MAECSITHHRQTATSTSNNPHRRKHPSASTSNKHKQPSDAAGTASTTGTPIPGQKPTASDGSSGPDDAAGRGGAGGGRGPLPWTYVGKGQHRRVLLPGNSRGCVGGGSAPRFPGVGGGGRGGASSEGGGGVEMNGGTKGSGGVKRGRGGAGGGGGCSLAHASRCLHNVLYLCAARAQVRTMRLVFLLHARKGSPLFRSKQKQNK